MEINLNTQFDEKMFEEGCLNTFCNFRNSAIIMNDEFYKKNTRSKCTIAFTSLSIIITYTILSMINENSIINSSSIAFYFSLGILTIILISNIFHCRYLHKKYNYAKDLLISPNDINIVFCENHITIYLNNSASNIYKYDDIKSIIILNNCIIFKTVKNSFFISKNHLKELDTILKKINKHYLLKNNYMEY